MKYYNNNPKFGDSGPFEADSKNQVVNALSEQIHGWANEEIDRTVDDMTYHELEAYLSCKSREDRVREVRARITAEFIAALEDVTEEVIFDNGGGVTVQIHGYCHHYADPAQAAEDVQAWLDTESVDDWDGHEPESARNPTPEQIYNGGYRIWIIGDDYGVNYSWGNMTDFFKALEKGSEK